MGPYRIPGVCDECHPQGGAYCMLPKGHHGQHEASDPRDSGFVTDATLMHGSPVLRWGPPASGGARTRRRR